MDTTDGQPERTETRPTRFVTESSAEFFALCARAKAGEIIITQIERVRGQNGKWIVAVAYPQPGAPQQQSLL
jgi:hypothetical protein